MNQQNNSDNELEKKQKFKQYRKRFYASFWKRWLAMLIDVTIMNIAYYTFITILVLSSNYIQTGSLTNFNDMYPTPEQENARVFLGFLVSVTLLVGPWLYYSLFEKSKFQATPGKMIFRLVVVDVYFNQLSFGRATGRYWGAILSKILYIGYIMAAFTKHKQALHDLMANTYVVNKIELQKIQQFSEDEPNPNPMYNLTVLQPVK